MVKKEQKLIFVDVKGNNNKYYHIELHDDGRVVSKYGRVGKSEQTNDYGCVGESFYTKTINSKLKKGYTEAKVIATNGVINEKAVQNRDLASIALSQIKYSTSTLRSLITRLANSNIHKITSSTSIQFNAQQGVFTTPLGVVTLDAINEARDILAWFVDGNKLRKVDKAFEQKFNTYLRLIPQSIGMKLSISSVLPDLNAVKKQEDTLTALENSYKLVTAPAKTAASSKEAVENVFNLELDLNDNDAVNKELIRKYTATNKAMHSYQHIKVRNVYKVNLLDYNSKYKNIGNVQEVYHGSSEANILSILKSGLQVSPPSTAIIAGKMFGNGVYGSQTASKSLGYSAGRWGQSKGDCAWLFVCDFAMGNAFYPKTYGASSGVPKGYDSCWALPANTGLHNDELIVYNSNQIKIKYLLECNS